MSTAHTALTLAGFERLPEPEGVRYELDDGELIATARPKAKHARSERKLVVLLGGFLQTHTIGEVFTGNMAFLLGGDPPTLRCPDVSFVTAERARTIDPNGWITGAPDLAIEIVSPSDAAAELYRKVRQYLENGSSVVWVVYPDTQDVHEFRPTGTRIFHAGDLLEAPDLLPGFSVRVADLL